MPNPTPFPDWLYEYLQAPYNERQQAGQVVTPGAVDWGGMGQDAYNFLQQPYRDRMAREAQPPTTRTVQSIPVVNGVPVYPGQPGAYATPSPTVRPSGSTATASGIAGTVPLPPTYRPDPAALPYTPQAGSPLLAPYDASAAPRALPVPPSSPSTVYYPPGQEYGYNSRTGNYEVKQPGQAYTSVKAPNFPSPSLTANSATDAIVAATEPVALPRPRPSLPTMQKASGTLMPTYAGMQQPPSLIPHADNNLLAMLSGISQLGKSPLGGLAILLMGGARGTLPQGQPAQSLTGDAGYADLQPGIARDAAGRPYFA